MKILNIGIIILLVRQNFLDKVYLKVISIPNSNTPHYNFDDIYTHIFIVLDICFIPGRNFIVWCLSFCELIAVQGQPWMLVT